MSIEPVLSLATASKRLRQHPRYVKGLVDGLGIELKAIGTALALTESDFRRLEREIEQRQKEPIECG